jgi:hypothetical protein
MGRGRKIEDEDDALRCLEAAEQAGLSRRDWARSAGVEPRSLNAWRVNLERRARGAGPRLARALPLVELVPRRHPLEHAARTKRTAPQYCLEVDGIRLEFGDDATAATLRLVLEALRPC